MAFERNHIARSRYNVTRIKQTYQSSSKTITERNLRDDKNLHEIKYLDSILYLKVSFQCNSQPVTKGKQQNDPFCVIQAQMAFK